MSNAVQYFKCNNANGAQKKRSRKTTAHENRMITRLTKKEPFLGSVLIKHKIFGAKPTAEVSARTVLRRLVEAGWFGRVARTNERRLIEFLQMKDNIYGFLQKQK